MTSSNAKRTLAVCTFLLTTLPSVAFAQRTAADLESARQLYNQGIELRDKGDQKGALEKFRAAHALGNTPLTGIELCKTHAALGQPVEAREVCLGVARIPPMAQETQRSQDARAEAGKIAEDQRPRIGALRLKIKGVPEKREPTVTVDGINVPAAALNETRAVNPGIHVITARVGGGAETRATLETREGESRELELVVQPPPANEPPPPPPGGGGQPALPPKKKSNTFATVSFGVAAVSGTIGLLFGIDALAKKGKLEDKCPQNQCPRGEWERLEDAESSGNAATAFFVIGGVALGVGLVSTLVSSRGSSAMTTPPSNNTNKTANSKPTITPVFGLGGAGLHGTF
jgi:hypothetical protein